MRRWLREHATALMCFFDWRFFSAVGIALLLALLCLQQLSLQEREKTQRDSRSAASERITGLNDKIDRLIELRESDGRRIGELETQVAALVKQLEQSGEVPVVTPRATTTTTTTPRSQNRPTQSPQSPANNSPGTTTPPSSPPPTTQPPDDDDDNNLVGCIGPICI